MKGRSSLATPERSLSDPNTRIIREPAERWVAPDVRTDTGSGAGNKMTVDRLDSLQQSAYDEAFAQGLEAGRQAGHEEIARLALRLNDTIAALSEPFRELDDEVEQALVDLAIRVARQIIRREVKIDPGQIIGVLREAVELLPITSRIVEVHLHPEDAAVVREAFDKVGANLAWTMVEDPVITRGGLRVTTEASTVDARVESRLDAILSELTGGEREEDERE